MSQTYYLSFDIGTRNFVVSVFKVERGVHKVVELIHVDLKSDKESTVFLGEVRNLLRFVEELNERGYLTRNTVVVVEKQLKDREKFIAASLVTILIDKGCENIRSFPVSGMKRALRISTGSWRTNKAAMNAKYSYVFGARKTRFDYHNFLDSYILGEYYIRNVKKIGTDLKSTRLEVLPRGTIKYCILGKDFVMYDPQ